MDYPLMNLFWTMMWLFLWMLWLFLIIRVITDIFRSDAGGWAKAGWTIFVILLPFLGVFTYLIVCGRDMGRRDRAESIEAENSFRSYVREAASGSNVADQLATLADLRKQGVLTEDEFAQQKARILAKQAA